jgi:hypothetical protein
VDIKDGKSYLTEQDLQQHSIWIEHEDDDLTYPVYSLNDLPENMQINKLRIRATFTTRDGIALKGYIVGLKNIFCIVIFWNGEVLYLNKNLFNDCIDAINKISKLLNQNLEPEDYFPIRYETTIDIEGFKNVGGEFDIFKKRTDEDRFNG